MNGINEAQDVTYGRFRTFSSVRAIYTDILIALLPTLVFASIVYGARAVVLCAVSVIAAVVGEFAVEFIYTRRPIITDLSSVVVGVINAFMLPAAAPLWTGAVASVFSIVAIKFALKRSGSKIIVNSVMISQWLIRRILGGAVMIYSAAGEALPSFAVNSGAVSVTTPSEAFFTGRFGAEGFSLFDLLVGSHSGTIAQTSAIMLLLGGVYLIVRRSVAWQIPTAALVASAAVLLVFPQSGARFDIGYAVFGIISGSILFCSIFAATEFESSPVTPAARLVFGAIFGVFSVLFGYIGGDDGVIIALLLANLTAYPLDMLLSPKPFGAKKQWLWKKHR